MIYLFKMLHCECYLVFHKGHDIDVSEMFIVLTLKLEEMFVMWKFVYDSS
jgi:hypothetical protein